MIALPLNLKLESELVKARQATASFVRTQDGTVIVVDPEIGTLSGRTREEVAAEIRRRKTRPFDGWTVRHGERR
ncbi:MAG: hypothetical protein AB7I42_25075 [Bradyrhizobium sp.]|uniref:hypothetical protein n=1 Tax=Bradyrhizobium sp. TaxID=376 RepID=UPI003D0B5812